MGDEYQRARDEFDPVYYLIGFAIFIALFLFFQRPSRKQAEKKAESNDPKKTFFTRDQLRRDFDGKGPSGKTYVACNDTVFDVTGSPHYMEGGGYASFAGRDITMAAAMHSTDENHLSHVCDMTNLTVSQEQNVMMFFMTFCQKYPIVGKLRTEGDSVKDE